MHHNTIKNYHVFVKNLWQCFLVAFEFGGISALFVCNTARIVPCSTVIEVLERGTLGLALYEFIIFMTLNFINDAKQDEYNALNSMYKLAIVACEESDSRIKEKVKSYVKKELDNGVMNSVSVRQEYEILLNLMKDNDIPSMKYKQIIIENQQSMAGLQWKYTVLLRLIK